MQNFWEKSGWESEDPHLLQMAAMPFRRDFPFIPEAPGLYVFRGPRQIGKTSWLKTILSHYTKNKAKVFYLSCENIISFKELAEILKSLKAYDLVLLDEINFVENWDRAVKNSVDSGYPKRLIITGSHAHDLKQGADRMPGRFGSGGEFELLPMQFEEFTKARIDAGWSSEDRLTELQAYFISGGFPIAVAESGKNSKIPKKSIQTYLRWLIGDTVKLGKQEIFIKEILSQLALCLQTPLSLQTLAKKTSIGSHNTVQEYIAVLESCFAVRTLYAIDLDTGAYRFKKDKKFYFTDPLLYWLSLEMSGTPDSTSNTGHEQKLAEMVAHEALARKKIKFGYHSNSNGEIDFIAPQQWALEVKWAPVAQNLSKSYLNLTLLDKTVWTQNNFLQEWPGAFIAPTQ